MIKVLLALALLAPLSAHAGLMELGFSGSYRDSRIDADNYQETTSLTGTFSYYFMELSALEFSYTNGETVTGVKSDSSDALVYTRQFEMLGVDLVFALAGRKASFQPFIKAGAAKITQDLFVEDTSDGSVENITDDDSAEKVVPTAGAGFKMRLTQTFSIKVSYDTWRSASTDDSETWDQAFRAGLSWIF